MRTPVAALLWESWRLTRVEMAFRIALALILGAVPLALPRLETANPANAARLADAGAVVALFVIVVIAMPFWFSIALLKGGRPIDGGRPGFPFSTGYPRPVRTGILVGVPMMYFALAAAASYVVPAVLLGAVFGYAFPLAPPVAWLIALSLIQAATNWWTHSKTVQLAGSMAAVFGCTWLMFNQLGREELVGSAFLPAQWPTRFAFSLGDYGAIGSIAVASVALAVASVAQQRRGDTLIHVGRVAGAGWLQRWHVDAFRFHSPLSTPARAQWWFELRRTGVPLLIVGTALAVTIPALLAAVATWETAQLFAPALAVLAPFAVVRMGIDNVFGLQRKPGRTYASTFDASQAIATLPLVTFKVLARTSCFIVALASLGVSFWMSVPLLHGWATILPSNYDALTGGQRAVAAAVEALTGLQRAALAVLLATGICTTVAHVASLQVLRLLHPMRVYAGSLALLVYTLMFLLWSSDGASGFETAIAKIYPWALAAAISLSTLHVFRLALMERLITARHAAGAVLLWTVCVVSWLTLAQGGLEMTAMPLASIALLLSLNLLPATAVALTPWAYSLVRHR